MIQNMNEIKKQLVKYVNEKIKFLEMYNEYCKNNKVPFSFHQELHDLECELLLDKYDTDWTRFLHINYAINDKKTEFCKEVEKIENYEMAKCDNFQNWIIHHRKEIELNKSATELEEMGLYYDRPADELIFLPINVHTILHKYGNVYGKTYISKFDIK